MGIFQGLEDMPIEHLPDVEQRRRDVALGVQHAVPASWELRVAGCVCRPSHACEVHRSKPCWRWGQVLIPPL